MAARWFTRVLIVISVLWVPSGPPSLASDIPSGGPTPTQVIESVRKGLFRFPCNLSQFSKLPSDQHLWRDPCCTADRAAKARPRNWRQTEATFNLGLEGFNYGDEGKRSLQSRFGPKIPPPGFSATKMNTLAALTMAPVHFGMLYWGAHRLYERRQAIGPQTRRCSSRPSSKPNIPWKPGNISKRPFPGWSRRL